MKRNGNSMQFLRQHNNTSTMRQSQQLETDQLVHPQLAHQDETEILFQPSIMSAIKVLPKIRTQQQRGPVGRMQIP